MPKVYVGFSDLYPYRASYSRFFSSDFLVGDAKIRGDRGPLLNTVLALEIRANQSPS